MEKLENYNLDFFLQEVGILPVKSELEELTDLSTCLLDDRTKCMTKGYYRNPYDENGELLF